MQSTSRRHAQLGDSFTTIVTTEPAQVATDTRLWLYKELQLVQAALHDLIRASVDRAEADVEVLMPGFTHLQVSCIGMHPQDICCDLAQRLLPVWSLAGEAWKAEGACFSRCSLR